MHWEKTLKTNDSKPKKQNLTVQFMTGLTETQKSLSPLVRAIVCLKPCETFLASSSLDNSALLTLKLSLPLPLFPDSLSEKNSIAILLYIREHFVHSPSVHSFHVSLPFYWMCCHSVKMYRRKWTVVEASNQLNDQKRGREKKRIELISRFCRQLTWIEWTSARTKQKKRSLSRT